MKKFFVFLRVVFLFASTTLAWHVSCIGSAADTQASLPGADGELRSMTGNIAGGNAALTQFAGKTRALTTITCADTTICCYDPEGEVTAVTLDSSCNFDLPLATGQVYYCGVFSGTDADSDTCGDTYLSSLGCSEDGYTGETPVFEDTDGTNDDIALGASNFAGHKLITDTDACAQVDQDGDGTANASDTDDDGDGTLDTDDNQEGSLARSGLDDLDSNADGIPDIFQSIWDSLVDNNSDGIPDYFDIDAACSSVSDDSNGDCIPDTYDLCAYDGDEDHFNWCLDCDDSDATTTTACYYGEDLGFDYCALDNDADGLDICRDCDDENDSVTNQCYSGDFGNLCETLDSDGDGFSYCYDCDDYDTASTFECYNESSDWCSQDNDSDGINVCSDCDDFSTSSTTECYVNYDFCSEDGDSDGTGYCEDCNDANPDVTTDCSSQDNDEDGVQYSQDCNDSDASITTTYDEDVDGDGYGACYDCDDTNVASTYECYGSYDYCSTDSDTDGVSACEDCNDYDSTITGIYGTDSDSDGYDSCYDCDDTDSAIGYCE